MPNLRQQMETPRKPSRMTRGSTVAVVAEAAVVVGGVAVGGASPRATSGTSPTGTQHCILSIGVHIARYMKLLHLARNMHLARIARNMHDSVICADCARHAPVMQNYDRFLALRAMCTSSKFTIVRNMRIVSKWAYCAPCALRYAHYMHICQNPPDRVCTRLGL